MVYNICGQTEKMENNRQLDRAASVRQYQICSIKQLPSITQHHNHMHTVKYPINHLKKNNLYKETITISWISGYSN